MSWVNDLASGLGIPAGAATLAVAMYSACVAAEKAARPEALKDIGRKLKDTSWERSVRPSAIIQQIFVWTFGERHLSWACLTRSWFATLVITGAFTVIWFKSVVNDLLLGTPFLSALPGWLLAMTLVAAIPDYVALGKTRFLLKLSLRSPVSYIMPVYDIILSVAISIGVLSAFFFLANHYSWTLTWVDMKAEITDVFAWYARGIEDNSGTPLASYAIFIASTLLTSIWTILILLSMVVIKLLAPLQRFTGWFFDLQNHPVRAVGIVSGALVMAGSLIWTVLRAVI